MDMDTPIERDLGEQPLAQIMRDHTLKPHDLTQTSAEQITHKMVNRAMKGRRLTPHVQRKILNALNKATQKQFVITDIFTY